MRAALVCLLVLVAACGGEPRGAAETYVTVTGPRDWAPPEEMVLEANETAWAITTDGGGGVVSFEHMVPTTVRLFGVPSCTSYTAFTAEPGAAYIVRFGAGDSARVEVVTHGTVEAGPALQQGTPSGC